MDNDEENEWRMLALQAVEIAFTEFGDKKNISQNDLSSAISLFYQSILAGANQYWPYIKLADLVVNEQEKLKLYAQAWKIEQNIYSAEKLFNQILIDHPNILDTYG
jgi:hypothetical protein